MHAFLCAIDETVWDSVENGWAGPITPKAEWDKATFALANANSKAINAIFCGVSIDEFHKISHAKTVKEAWKILETNYEGTKKVKDNKLQMLTTRLNEILIAKLNLGEKIEDAKVERKVLRSLPESFRAKVTAIKESKDLDEIKIQEFVDSLQIYKLRLPYHKSSKSLALKTINERIIDSSNKDDIEKEAAYLANNFCKFLKMKNNGKSFSKGKFSSFRNDKKDFKKKDGRESSPSQWIVCYECNGHGHSKKECLNYSRGKDGLSELVEEFSVHSDVKEDEVLDDEEVYLNEGDKKIQDVYEALLKDCGKYAKVAKSVVKKMKRIEENNKSTLA
nr:uncharacterized protein LOC111993111 [Quercus suber]